MPDSGYEPFIFTTNLIMTKKLLFILLLFIGINTYGQKENTSIQQTFENVGLRQITEVNFAKQEIDQIVSFNYEPFRKQNTSVIIKIVGGPHLELFSRNRFELGVLDQPEKVSNNLSQSDQNSAEHEHVAPSDVKIKKFEIIVLNLFDIPTNLESK